MSAFANPFDQVTHRLISGFSSGGRIAILGSTDFWNPDSEKICAEVGRLLAGIPDAILVTGGVEGIGEAVGRSFFRARIESGMTPKVIHVLPIGEDSWDYGETVFAGADMTERREILGRISSIYVLIEGGPRTEHEVEVALAHQAFVIPVARCGGFASALYESMERPGVLTEGTWELLGSKIASIDATANAVFQAVTSCLEALDVPKV